MLSRKGHVTAEDAGVVPDDGTAFSSADASCVWSADLTESDHRIFGLDEQTHMLSAKRLHHVILISSTDQHMYFHVTHKEACAVAAGFNAEEPRPEQNGL